MVVGLAFGGKPNVAHVEVILERTCFTAYMHYETDEAFCVHVGT